MKRHNPYREPTRPSTRERVLVAILVAVAALGLGVHTCGCAHLRGVPDDVELGLLTADILLGAVVPVCEATPYPECALLPRVTEEVARARALFTDGNIDAARDALDRAQDSLTVLEGVLR